MHKNKKKSKGRHGLLASRFYRVYFVVVGVALALIVFGLIWLRGVVADYEVSQPVHAAEEVARLFEDGDYDRIYALDTSSSEISGGDKALYVERLTKLAEGGRISWREAYSEDANVRKYSVTLNGDKLATFTLVPSGHTTGHGNTLWKLGEITTHVAVEGSEAAEAAAEQQSAGQPADANAVPCWISAPAGYAVTVDGRALGEADVVSSGTPILPENFLPTGVIAPTMTEYAFYSESESPAISVTDPSGGAAEVQSDGENRWTCPLKEDTAFAEQFGPAVISLAEKIALYTVKDMSRSAVMKYVASESPAESILRQFSNDWAPSHKTATVTDAKVSDFYVLSDDCFTCHVEFTFTLRTRRGNDYVYPTSYTFCVVKRKGTGKLYNITFN